MYKLRTFLIMFPADASIISTIPNNREIQPSAICGIDTGLIMA